MSDSGNDYLVEVFRVGKPKAGEWMARIESSGSLSSDLAGLFCYVAGSPGCIDAHAKSTAPIRH